MAPPKVKVPASELRRLPILCLNCDNRDPAQMDTNYASGDYVCKLCAAVNPNRVLSTEEESRVFADDSAADREMKKRSEYRSDGGVGSFIAGGVQSRYQLPNQAIIALQRTQLKLQDAPPEVIDAANRAGKPKPRARSLKHDAYKAEIDKLADKAKAKVPDAMREDAKRLVDTWASKLADHEARCKDEKCQLSKRTMPRPQGAAAAFLKSASNRSADGAGATRALQEFEEFIEASARKSMRAFYTTLEMQLSYDKTVGCQAADGGPGAGSKQQLSIGTSKGLVSRAIGHLCPDRRAVQTQIETHTFGLLDWLWTVSLLVGKQPKTVAAATLVLACAELLRAKATCMDDFDAPSVEAVATQLDISATTVQAAIDEIKKPREAYLAQLESEKGALELRS